MTRIEFDISRRELLNDEETKKGIDLFEKYIGRIEWLHPDVKPNRAKGEKKYSVIDEEGKIIYEADKIADIAKEFDVSLSRASICLNSVSLLNGRYLIKRWGDE